MKPLNILVVDDSKNMRLIVKRYLKLEFENIIFFEAGDGAEAEKVLQEQALNNKPIDVVFLDWMMPKVSGLEFLEKIRAVEKFSIQPSVIMLTAETYSDQLNAAMKYGVSSYITKPFSSEDLKLALELVKEKIDESGGLKDAV